MDATCANCRVTHPAPSYHLSTVARLKPVGALGKSGRLIVDQYAYNLCYDTDLATTRLTLVRHGVRLIIGLRRSRPTGGLSPANAPVAACGAVPGGAKDPQGADCVFASPCFCRIIFLSLC